VNPFPGELDRRSTIWLAYVLAGSLSALAFLLLPAASLAQDIVYDGVAVSSGVAILVAIRLHQPSRVWPWRLLALGLFSFAVGDMLWVAYSLQGERPFPSLADVFYLAGYPFLAGGLLLGMRNRLTGGDRSGLLDAAILATSAAILMWTVQIAPLASGFDPDPFAFAVSLAYPVMDLLVIGVGIGLLATAGSRTMSFGLISLSLVTILVADQLFAIQTAEGTYVDGGPLDVLWLISYLLWGAAALHRSMAAVFEPRPVAVALLGPVRMAFLLAALLTGPGLLVLAQPEPSIGILIIAAGSALLAVLVVIRLAGLVGLLSADIAKRRVLEAELTFHANHDPLTGLTNRRLFVASVESAIENSQAGGAPIAVVFLDLDDFKTVNDTMGHDAGDRMLVAVAARIRSCLRSRDVAARLGGDEFAVLLQPITGSDEAELVATRLIASLGAPLVIAGRTVPVAASAGVAVAGPATRSVDELMRAADIAMYSAKARGKDRYQLYSPALEPPPDPAAAVSADGAVEPDLAKRLRVGARRPAAT